MSKNKKLIRRAVPFAVSLLKSLPHLCGYLTSMSVRLFELRKTKTVYIFGSPDHSNLGDQAQTYCIQKWVAENLPGYRVFTFTQFKRGEILILKVLRLFIAEGSIMVCHSGYHMTELYALYKIYKGVANSFKDFPVVVFPQTVNFINPKEGERVARVFDSHPNLTLMCRDEVSYEAAKKIFKKTRLLLYPDIVTSLIGTLEFPSGGRSGILFCLRNDMESFYSAESIEKLRAGLSSIGEKISRTDTTLKVPPSEIIANRESFLKNTLKEYSKYRLIITDRYHGTIFSVIAGTPVIVISSADHKLSSGVKWFPKDVFSDYIRYAESLEDAQTIAFELLNAQVPPAPPPYFKLTYYDKLLPQLCLNAK